MRLNRILMAVVLPIGLLIGLMMFGTNVYRGGVPIHYNAPPLKLANNQQLTVYYFHGNVRCSTCRQIEQYLTKGLQQGYPDRLKYGALTMQNINVGQTENEHYIDDFQLVTLSAVLALHQDNQTVAYRRLDRVWELVSTQQKFVDYLYTEIEQITSGAAHG